MADEKPIFERRFIVPLRRGFTETPRHKRAKRAVSVLKEFVRKHAKVEKVKIGEHLNELIWENGMRNPPGRVSVNVTKYEDFATVELDTHKFVDKRKQEKAPEPTTLKDKLAAKLDKKDDKKVEKEAEEKVEKDVEKAKAENTPKEPEKKQ